MGGGRECRSEAAYNDPRQDGRGAAGRRSWSDARREERCRTRQRSSRSATESGAGKGWANTSGKSGTGRGGESGAAAAESARRGEAGVGEHMAG